MEKKCEVCSKYRKKVIDAEIRYVNMYGEFSRLYDALKEITEFAFQPGGAGPIVGEYMKMRSIAEKALE